jgi:beta-mannanase
LANESEVEEIAEEEVINEVDEVEMNDESIDEVQNYQDIISSLNDEVAELKNSLSIYKENEEKEAKTEVLNAAGINVSNHDKWMNLDIETIKSLTKTVTKKAPVVTAEKVSNEVVSMSSEDKKELLRSNPAEYANLVEKGLI